MENALKTINCKYISKLTNFILKHSTVELHEKHKFKYVFQQLARKSKLRRSQHSALLTRCL